MIVAEAKKVMKTPTAPTYITITIQEGSLYLSLLRPSIWKGRHVAAEKAAIIFEMVVNILKVPIPASELSLLKKSNKLKLIATKVKTMTNEQITIPEMQRILLIFLALTIGLSFITLIILSSYQRRPPQQFELMDTSIGGG